MNGRVTQRRLARLLNRYTPLDAYFSVLEYLHPERVSGKRKLQNARPIGGIYLVDVEAPGFHMVHRGRRLRDGEICPVCLELARQRTIFYAELIEQYYQLVRIQFSGWRGFHIFTLDFYHWDWAQFKPESPVKSFEKARYRFTMALQSQGMILDRRHFTVSVDPLRIVRIPETLHGRTGLAATLIGGRKDLERLTIREIIGLASPSTRIHPETPTSTKDGGQASMNIPQKRLQPAGRGWRL